MFAWDSVPEIEVLFPNWGKKYLQSSPLYSHEVSIKGFWFYWPPLLALEKGICPNNARIPNKLLKFPLIFDSTLHLLVSVYIQRMFTMLEEENYSLIISPTWLYKAIPHNSGKQSDLGLIQGPWLHNKPEIISCNTILSI